MEFYESFLGGPVRSLDYIWVRNVRVGSATPVHFDWVYMGRGTRNLYTTWIPMGDVPLTDGPLALLEGSHRIAEIQRTYGALDVDRDGLWDKEAPQYKSGWLRKERDEDSGRVRRTLAHDRVSGGRLPGLWHVPATLLAGQQVAR